MKKVSMGFIFILTLFFIISSVSANENITDDTVEIEDNSDLEDEVVLKEESESETTSNSTPTATKISSADVKGYESFTASVNIKLTANNTPLTNKTVKINVNKNNYLKTTDANGEVKLNLNLKKGTYVMSFTFLGDENYTQSNGTSKLTIKSPTKTKVKVADKYVNYRQGSKSVFYVKLTTSGGKAISGQTVTFKVNGKTYTAVTNKNGYAKIYLSLKKGKYKVKYYFSKKSPYLSSSGSYKIKVRSKMAKGNGYWVWANHMKKVPLKKIAKKGTKHIFLHCKAISKHGKSKVVKWIKKAKKYGLYVHIWMQVCYSNGDWAYPVKKNGKYKKSFINKKVKLAKKYAKIKGVSGVHLDYIRFGGTAHKYKNAEKVITYVTKKISTKVHKIKSNCIVSAAVMPEPKMMSYYYGQNIGKMSKYLDAIVPMEYKGNYHKKTSWIKSVTKSFVKDSNGAQIWCGLQAYKSDDDLTKLSYKSLLKDAKAAISGGATGVFLFRYGLTRYLNFKKL